MKTYIAVLLTLLALGTTWARAADSNDPAQSHAVFYVAWYDVGKSALEGLKGVIKVTSGFRGLREINTVTYDPRLISTQAMAAALKSTGTYLGQAPD
jgi:hypothetical protein